MILWPKKINNNTKIFKFELFWEKEMFLAFPFYHKVFYRFSLICSILSCIYQTGSHVLLFNCSSWLNLLSCKCATNFDVSCQPLQLENWVPWWFGSIVERWRNLFLILLLLLCRVMNWFDRSLLCIMSISPATLNIIRFSLKLHSLLDKLQPFLAPFPNRIYRTK